MFISIEKNIIINTDYILYIKKIQNSDKYNIKLINEDVMQITANDFQEIINYLNSEEKLTALCLKSGASPKIITEKLVNRKNGLYYSVIRDTFHTSESANG